MEDAKRTIMVRLEDVQVLHKIVVHQRRHQRLPRQKPSSNDDLLAEIAAGNIPGTAGKDYPVNSLAAWRKRPGYENIELAPADLVVAGYPFPSGGGGGARGGKRKSS